MTLKEALDYFMDEFHLSDKFYEVKDRVFDIDPTYQGYAWDHPSMKKFGEAIDAIQDARRKLK